MTSTDPITATQFWLQHIVIGENFCPFAKRDFERQRIRYVTSHAADLAAISAQLCDEYKMLDDDPNGDIIETTLIIFTASGNQSTDIDAQNFDDFLILSEEAEWQLKRLGYEGIYQLATFHPDYLFAGEALDSPSHYTNRSPYPMLHIIRERSIERVLRTYKQPESIPNTNIKHAYKLGIDYFQQQLDQALKTKKA